MENNRSVNPPCRNCVAKLKKSQGLIEQIEKLEELKSLNRSEVSLALKRSGELLVSDQDGLTSNGIEGTRISFR